MDSIKSPMKDLLIDHFAKIEGPCIKKKDVLPILVVSILSSLIYIIMFYSISSIGLFITDIVKRISPLILKTEITTVTSDVIWLGVLIFSVLTSTWIMAHRLKNEFNKEKVAMKALYENLLSAIDKLDIEQKTITAFQKALSEEHPVFKSIQYNTTPTNKDIDKKLDSYRNENYRKVVETINLVRLTYELPEKIRVALGDIIKKEFIKKPWGPLYLTFAIKLQLSPWIENVTNEFTFIRDIEEMPKSDQVKFDGQLKNDLKEILELVNGKLWSVMFNDIHVWNYREYFQSNNELLKNKQQHTELKRMFIYKNEWLIKREYLRPLLMGALWHLKNKGYGCKFVEVSKVNPYLIKVEQKEMLASCLINKTVIKMDKETDAHGQSRRFKYYCDSSSDAEKTYENWFDDAWNTHMEAMSPELFIAHVKKTQKNICDDTAKEFQAMNI